MLFNIYHLCIHRSFVRYLLMNIYCCLKSNICLQFENKITFARNIVLAGERVREHVHIHQMNGIFVLMLAHPELASTRHCCCSFPINGEKTAHTTHGGEELNSRENHAYMRTIQAYMCEQNIMFFSFAIREMTN